jgi:hypothetical protein
LATNTLEWLKLAPKIEIKACGLAAAAATARNHAAAPSLLTSTNQISSLSITSSWKFPSVSVTTSVPL